MDGEQCGFCEKESEYGTHGVNEKKVYSVFYCGGCYNKLCRGKIEPKLTK